MQDRNDRKKNTVFYVINISNLNPPQSQCLRFFSESFIRIFTYYHVVMVPKLYVKIFHYPKTHKILKIIVLIMGVAASAFFDITQRQRHRASAVTLINS